jgi:hypothetical protein
MGLPESRARSRAALACLIALAAAGCASLGGLAGLVRAPRFQRDDQRPAELRLFGRTSTGGLGGAGVRLWARVYNPNPFGLTLSTLRGSLFLEGTRSATVDLPLGLPLVAQEEQAVPIDISIDVADLPGLVNVVGRAVTGQTVGYRLDGTIGVDAGALGTPTFGPMTLVRGDAQVRR